MLHKLKSAKPARSAQTPGAITCAGDPTQEETSDLIWMQKAIEQAGCSGLDVPVGAVVVRDGVLLSAACNKREATGDPTAHAEIVAIRQAAALTGSWRLTGTSLYTTLEPCAMCAEALIQARVSRLIFGAYDQASGAAGSAFNLFISGRVFPIPEVLGGLLEQECQNLLIDFFQKKLRR